MFEKVKNIAIISRDYIFVMGLFAVSYVCSVVGAIGNSIARENIRENKEGDDQHRIT
jgi:hypothetical protein